MCVLSYHAMENRNTSPDAVQVLRAILFAFKGILGVAFLLLLLFLKSDLFPVPYRLPAFAIVASIFVLVTIFDIALRWRFPRQR